ncbi:MAG: HAMP domain-containing histidine kinase [Thermodesulfobacteria bacterium]|nr:HAMP domain-containing histidine kinase [Thermodesulfobacteriota bacterium]
MKRSLTWIYNLTFQQRLIMGIAVLMGITTLSLGIAGNELAKNFLLIRFADRMDFLAKYLAANSELGILLGDRAMLKRLATNLLAEEDVVEVIIKDDKGNVLAKVSTGQIAPSVKRTSAPVILSTASENLVFGKGKPSKKTIGMVEIAYVTTSIDELTQKLQFSYLLLTLVIFTVGIIFFLFFTRSLTAPLANLIEAAQKVAEGDLEVQLQKGTLPETRKLAQAFNSMTMALKQSRRDLEETYQKLVQEQALAEVGHFAVTVAHEVKNPLGIIKGALDILKKPEIDDEVRATMISYVEDEIKRLDLLIRDFLDFSRPKPLNFERVDLGQLINEIVNRMQLEWAAKEITISVKENIPDAFIQADKEALSRAIVNIIKNGCEASSKGQEVTIRLLDEGSHYRLIIADEGMGIPDVKKDKIFEPFFTGKTKGTGLGLTLTKKIIEAHMGQIEVKDNEPTGTKIEIIFWKMNN